MTVTPDDSARLQHAGIVLLTNLGSVLTVTLLHGNDIIYLANALIQLLPFHIRCIHNGLLYCSAHHFVRLSSTPLILPSKF